MKGGQVIMGGNQPRPQVQQRIPGPPPRGGSGQARAEPPVQRVVVGFTRADRVRAQQEQQHQHRRTFRLGRLTVTLTWGAPRRD